MEISARKQAVLAAIVRAYIETGEPVGSKSLTVLLDNAPSSATLRNEMSDLCALGLLSQPHTSAGRVPTSRGLRFYLNSLMQPLTVSDATKRYIDSRLAETAATERLPELAADVLSELTGFPAISCFTVDESVTLDRIETVPLGGRTVMLLLVTSDGRAHSRLCRIGSGMRFENGEPFREIVRKSFRKVPLCRLNKAYLQNVIASAGLNALAWMPVFTALFEAAEELARSRVSIRGQSGLYNLCGEDNAHRILNLAARCDPFLSIFERQERETAVIFGNDTGFPELGATALATGIYGNGKQYCGRIGIIGPTRMSYEQIIPSIEYTASRLTEWMAQAEKDMED